MALHLVRPSWAPSRETSKTPCPPASCFPKFRILPIRGVTLRFQMLIGPLIKSTPPPLLNQDHSNKLDSTCCLPGSLNRQRRSFQWPLVWAAGLFTADNRWESGICPSGLSCLYGIWGRTLFGKYRGLCMSPYSEINTDNTKSSFEVTNFSLSVDVFSTSRLHPTL